MRTKRPRPWRWADVEDIEWGEWKSVLTEYRVAGSISGADGECSKPQPCGHPELVRLPGTQSARDRGAPIIAVRVVGPERRGRRPLLRHHATDEVWAVRTFAAHALAWKIRRVVSSGYDTVESIAGHLGLEVGLVSLGVDNPKSAVRDLIHHYCREPVSERTLKTYLRYFCIVNAPKIQRLGVRRAIEDYVRLFLSLRGIINEPARHRHHHDRRVRLNGLIKSPPSRR